MAVAERHAMTFPNHHQGGQAVRPGHEFNPIMAERGLRVKQWMKPRSKSKHWDQADRDICDYRLQPYLK